MMVGALSLLVVTLAAPALGQPRPIEHPDRMIRFLDALADLDRDLHPTPPEPAPLRVRVTHFGDSHVAADLWTGWIRAGLQARFGDGGRGYVVPGKPWRTYWQSHVRTSSEGAWRVDGLRGGLDDGRYGPAGCSVASADPDAVVRVATPERTTSAAGFTRLDVHYLRQPGGGCFEIAVDGEAVRSVGSRGPWPDPAVATVDVPPGPHAVEIRPRGGGEVRLLGTSMENLTGVIYEAMGINGARADRQLRWDEAAFGDVVRRLAPNLIVLSYGANELFDARLDLDRYAVTLEAVVERLRAAAPDSDCLLTGPPDMMRRRRPPEQMPAVYDIQRRVAAEQGCAFWDARAAMGGRGSIRRWRRAKMAQRDLVHLTRDGYAQLGALMLRALEDAYDARRAEVAKRAR